MKLTIFMEQGEVIRKESGAEGRIGVRLLHPQFGGKELSLKESNLEFWFRISPSAAEASLETLQRGSIEACYSSLQIDP